ncbi:MAG: hypothetical protein IKZ53_06815 [Selenomonadaceae bacterium]|nr:hypothetical protein [Selenomonadaceae bacterium]
MNEELFDAAEDFIQKFYGDLRNLRGNFIEELLREELNRGYYGATAEEIFFTLTTDEQDLILQALKLQELSEGRQLKFMLALKSLFPDSEIYFYKKFLLYLPEEESEATLKKIELIKILFMEVGNTEIEIYFGKCFGVFGKPQTMRLDEMILY